MRSFGRDEDHPTITKFSQLYRLLSLYTPVKAATKGNCLGEHDAVLVSFENSLKTRRERHKCEKAITEEEISLSLRQVCDGASEEPRVDLDHVYSCPSVEDTAVYYLCGYVVHKCRKMITCQECLADITADENVPPEVVLTLAKSYVPGSLLHPSTKMFKCLKLIECIVHAGLEKKKVLGDMFWHILDSFAKSSVEPLGCRAHCDEFTVRVIKFYLVTRMHFHSRAVTKDLSTNEKVRHARKKTKLL